jgi:hypothetical protein
MKLIVIVLLASICSFKTSHWGGHKLTIGEAERIMGESCALKEDTVSQTDGGHKSRMKFVAKVSEKNALYYSFESFKDDESAKKLYNTWKESNQVHQGFEILENMGDDGFFQSDNANFYTLITRKGNEILVLKVNKISPKTSIREMKKVTGELLKRI